MVQPMDSEQSSLKYWLAFHRVPGIGRVRFSLLERHFASLGHAWEASRLELLASGLDERTVSQIINFRQQISPEAELELLERHGIQALTWHDATYPTRLKEIDDPPPVLYLKGELLPQDEWAVTVVGTRRATPYGRQAAEHFAGDLARGSITVVSGLARGIDAVAHAAALDAGGRTIAVLACGLDIIYPPEHRRLARQIQEHGALLSEYPLGTQPRPDYFPRRNRIMSGIALGTLVIEADEQSGALITARLALEQNREVFAVPGSIFAPSSRGVNKLIRDGSAKLVLTIRDVLEELNLTQTQVAEQLVMQQLLPANEAEQVLLRELAAGPLHIDEVRRASGLPIDLVSSTLAMMELKGLVKLVGPMTYGQTREAAAIYQAV